MTAAPDIAGRMRRVNVMQGMSHVTDEPGVVLFAVLGSCVACCLYDPRARIGGMNHFLLPEPRHGRIGAADAAQNYGLYAMETLVDAMLRKGADRVSLQAHLYGGANMHAGMQAIGTGNIRYARTFLTRMGIRLSQTNVGGDVSRRVDFRAAGGQVRCRIVSR